MEIDGNKYKIVKNNKIPFRTVLSSKKINLINKCYEQNPTQFKPTGFWYGIKYYWLDFMMYDYGLEDYTVEPTFKPKKNEHYYKGFLYEVVIPFNIFINITHKPSQNKILILKTKSDMIRFTKKYGERSKIFYGVGINWNNVMEEYGGIEILYKQNTGSNMNYIFHYWYSLFDVPSGCIWNYNIIKKIKLTQI